MVATVTVVELTGASGSVSYTTITDRVRLFTKDQATTQGAPQSTYPVVIPSGGAYGYSFWKGVALDLAGSGFSITNVRHYCDGAIGWNFGTSGELRRGNRDAGDVGCPSGHYVQATGTDGTIGDDLATDHYYYSSETAPTADIETDTSTDPATVDSSTYTTATKTKHIVLQVRLSSDATQGTQAAETLTWMYDES